MLEFFYVGPLDMNDFDGFLNFFIDLQNIVNCVISWNINYTQACTTRITVL